jgi:DNA-directed RNA polymerase specialized sigma24 family protein
VVSAIKDHPKNQELQARLLMLWERTNDTPLLRLAHGQPPIEGCAMATEQEHTDWVSTCLMAAFMRTGDPEVFALLFQLNCADFRSAIKGRLRGNRCVDADDVLQAVFLNICRYPHQFLADQSGAFRKWGYTIVRNTVQWSIRQQARQPCPLPLEDECWQPADERAIPPGRAIVEHESAGIVDRAFVLFLGIYLFHFQRLSPREQRALTLVEIQGSCYRDAAHELGIPVANLKMLIFRGRRRILRGVQESLARIARMESVTVAPPAGAPNRKPARGRRAQAVEGAVAGG